MNPVRQALVDSYGSIFQDIPPTQSCRTGTCTKLRHAFRRDDLSGTTDTFVSLVGLTTIANPTKAFANNSPTPDRPPSPTRSATRRQPMNKGDSDYLDLDPIRRAVDLSVVSGNRFGLEQVAELVPAFGGNNTDANCMRGAIPADRASSTQPGIWPDPNITNSQALLQADLGFDSVNGGLLPVPYAPTTRLCLGLVLPITLPANYSTPQQAYFGDATTGYAGRLRHPRSAGRRSGPRDRLDQHGHAAQRHRALPERHPPALRPAVQGGSERAERPNFNCFQDQLNPNLSGVQDMRVFNVHP